MDFFSSTMKKLIFFLLFTNLLFSQEIPSENYFWYIINSNDGENEAVIAAKNCYVREETSTNSTLLDSLQIGAKIKVLKNTEEYLNIKGLNLSWVKIAYQKNNLIKTGFLWKGFLALGSVTNGNTTFLTTFDSKFTKKTEEKNGSYDGEFYKISVKAIDSNHKIIGEMSFIKELYESIFFSNSIIGNWGLKNLSDVYRISFSGEACGIPTYHFYFGWNGKEFLLLPEKLDVGDAGVYYHHENFIFPKEKGGQENTIIKEKIESENIDPDSNDYIYKVSKEIEYYSWDGKNFKLTKTKKLKPYIKKDN